MKGYARNRTASGSAQSRHQGNGAGPRHRMAPKDRERLILDNAFRFFAERGIAGETRELARRLGVTQSLIYRYFPSKDVLIERVYEKWFAEYWDPNWADWIGERRLSLEERSLAFYRDYVRLSYNYEWVRLFAFSGLDGLPHHVRFVTRNREQLFRGSPASCATTTVCRRLEECR